MAKIVVITDSRGAGIQSMFDQLKDKNYSIQILVWKGKGVAEAVRESRKRLNWIAPDIVIIMAGICDLTLLDRTTRKVTIASPDEEKLVSDYEYTMDMVQHHLKVMAVGKEPKVVFGQLIGMDISVYNSQHVPNQHQETLDNAVVRINTLIAQFNMNNCASTPWTATDVHHNRKNGRKITRYNRLAPDGLHLTDALREKWVTAIDKVARKMVPELDHGR